MLKSKSCRSWTLVGLAIIYFLSRLQNLTAIPVFGDEAIYIRWAQVIKNVETLRFIPLTDGKQPLFMWLLAFGSLGFFKDPLIAGRLLSLFAGFINLIAIFFASALLANFSSSQKNVIVFVKQSIKRKFNTAFLSALIYTLLPFTFFFDRLALPDNLLSVLVTLSFIFSLLLAKFPRLDLSLILGLTLGLAWLTKSPAIYFLVLSFLFFLLINFRQAKKIVFPAISILVAFALYNTLRLGPQFHMIALRNQDYVWPLSKIIKRPLDPLIPHLGDLFTIFSAYIGWPLLLLTFFSLIKSIKFFGKQHLVLFAWFFLPLIATASLAKVFTARYILFTLPFLIIFISAALSTFKSPKFALVLICLVFNFPLIYKLSINPFAQKLPPTEAGYLQDWTSGWGIKQAADYLIDQSKTQNVIVGTEGSFGTLPDGLQIYTDSVSQLTVIGQGLGFTQVPDQLIDAKNYGDQVYLLINRSRLSIPDYNSFSIIKQYPKPDGDQLLLLKI
jgi:hypothetical protein